MATASRTLRVSTVGAAASGVSATARSLASWLRHVAMRLHVRAAQLDPKVADRFAEARKALADGTLEFSTREDIMAHIAEVERHGQ